MSFGDISQRNSTRRQTLDESTIRKAVQNTAKLVALSLRKSPGRRIPKK